jgi:WD40 repeat protein
MKNNFDSLILLLAELLSFFASHLLCEARTQKTLIHVLNTNEQTVSFVNMANSYLATGSFNGLIEILNVEEGFVERKLRSPTFSIIHSMVVLHNGFLAIGTENGIIEIWNLNDGLLAKSIQTSDVRINSLAVLKNGRVVSLSCIDESITIWDQSSWRMLNRFSNIQIKLMVTLDNDLLVGPALKRLDFLNITSGEIFRSLEGHESSINTIVNLPNGLLASGSMEGTINIWDLNKGILIKKLLNHSSSILSLASLKNGLLASLGSESIKIWDMHKGDVLKSFSINNYIKMMTVSSNGYLAGVHSNLKLIYVLNPEKIDYGHEETSLIDSGKILI